MLLSFSELQENKIRQNEYESSFSLSYKLICTKDPSPNAAPGLSNVYSVLIIMLHDDETPETAFIYDVSRCESSAKALIKLLRENAVTPCTAEYVIEDLL